MSQVQVWSPPHVLKKAAASTRLLLYASRLADLKAAKAIDFAEARPRASRLSPTARREGARGRGRRRSAGYRAGAGRDVGGE